MIIGPSWAAFRLVNVTDSLWSVNKSYRAGVACVVLDDEVFDVVVCTAAFWDGAYIFVGGREDALERQMINDDACRPVRRHLLN
jgi:hypothetical protein